MNNLLVCSCLKDDEFARISLYLLRNKTAEVMRGVSARASELSADVMYLLPEGEQVEGLTDDIRYGAYNPTLGNPYAVAELLSGNLPRPMIQDGFVARFREQAVHVITPEEAYRAATGSDTVWISVNDAEGKSEIKEVKPGSRAADLVDASGAKAVLVGGLKGRFVEPGALSDLSITEADTDKSLTIISDKTCIVDYAAKITERIWQASCGKCVLCREGSLQFKMIAADMVSGKAKPTDRDIVKKVGELIEAGAYCPFGRSMPGPFMSALDLFPDEFEAHIKRKECPLGICYKKEALYIILPDKCIGCGDCVDECDEAAIEGKKNFIHMIDRDMCENCGKCVEACDEDAIVKWTEEKLPKLPKKLTKVGKF